MWPSPSSPASAEPLSLPPQLPGWSQGPEGSLIIALGNEDALGEYSCTPYNSLGTAGPSPVTRVLLKVRVAAGALARGAEQSLRSPTVAAAAVRLRAGDFCRGGAGEVGCEGRVRPQSKIPACPTR